MKYLGVDYGKTKVGLSISEGLSASPLKVLMVSGLVDALKKIKLVIEREEIEQVVVGLPESGEARSIAEKFIKVLYPYIKIVVVEETLSSHNARANMLKLGKGKKERSKEDAFSATLILQEYLDDL